MMSHVSRVALGRLLRSIHSVANLKRASKTLTDYHISYPSQ